MPDEYGNPLPEDVTARTAEPHAPQVDEQGRILPEYRDAVLKAGLKLDAEGRPMTADGKYISPVAFGGAAPSNGSFLKTRPEFNQDTGRFESGVDWGNVLSAGVGGVLAAGALPAILGAGGGAGGATGAAAGGALPSTTVGSGFVPGIAGSAGLGAEAAGVGAGVLPSTVIGTGAIPAIAAPASAGGIATGGSILSNIGSQLGGLRGIGQAVSSATSAAGNTRRADTDTNVAAQSAYNSGLINRAMLEQQQRKQALADVYRNNWFTNQPRSPFNPTQRMALTPGYQQALSELEQQALARLQSAPQYATTNMPALEQYRSKPGTLERIGSVAGPAASILGSLGKIGKLF